MAHQRIARRGIESAHTAARDDVLGAPLGFLRRLWLLNHALERLSARMEKSLGVTAQQRLAIRCIGRMPGIVPGELAQVLHVDPGTVSAALKRLEKKGLVERRRDDKDGRRVTLTLTAAGRALERPTAGTVEAAVALLLRELDDEERRATERALARLTVLLGHAPERRASGARASSSRPRARARARTDSRSRAAR
jgi:MarR family transcriptional regulator, organic hydroperoxide resistance regulator